MNHFVLTFPVLPGKTEADIMQISNEFMAKPDEYRESRRNKGITFERAYLQKTPMGDFVIAYGESDKTVGEVFADLATSSLDIDRMFREKVLEIHGIDVTQPPPGPGPETVYAWLDPQVSRRGSGMAFTAPLVEGGGAKGKAFFEEVKARQGEFDASRRALGQNGEVITLAQTPQGEIASVYLEGADSFEGNRKFAASQTPFDVWFKDRLKEIVPPFIDFSQPVPGVTEIFDSQGVLARA